MLRKTLSFILGVPIKPASKHVKSPVQMSNHQRLNRERELIHRESKIGASLFGPIPSGHNREFFCLDQHTWVWSEEWVDPKTLVTIQMNTHYEFQPRGVLKVVNGEPRGYVEGQELTHLLSVIKTYHDRVAVEVYGYAPAAA